MHQIDSTNGASPTVESDGPVARVAYVIDAAQRELTPEEFVDFASSLDAYTTPLAHGTHPGQVNALALAALSPRGLSYFVEVETIIASVAGSGSVSELAQVATCVRAHLKRARPRRTPLALA